MTEKLINLKCITKKIVGIGITQHGVASKTVEVPK